MFFKNIFKSENLSEIDKEILKEIEENMVVLDKGSFLMGSNEGEDDESPIHNVLLDKFKMSKYVVTQEEWSEVMHSRPWKESKFSLEGDSYPAVNMTWYEAKEFIEILNKNTEEKFRLPTEAEWEYACRAGNSEKFSFGVRRNSLTEYAWFYDNAFKKGKRAPEKAGLLLPNNWGLYDMQGNVYEWCEDWFRRNYYNKSPLYNPKGPRYGKYKSVRGGDWARTDYFLRVSSRRHYTPHHKDSFIGFRLVKEIKVVDHA